MTPEQLNAIKERASKATVGPWVTAEEIDGVYSGMKTVVRSTDPPSRWSSRIVSVGQTRRHVKEDAENNAEFIAQARQDIPALIAEVERLKSALSEIADIDDWDYGLDNAKDITYKTIGEPKEWN